MQHYRVRIKNRLLQAMYRPRVRSIIPTTAWQVLDEIDKGIEDKITPLLSELFE